MLTVANGRLIDGTGRDPIGNVSITIDGNRIKSVEPAKGYPHGTNVVNLRGFILMLGLIDCHLHLGGLTEDKPGKAIGRVSFMDMVSFFWDYLRKYNHRKRLAIENGVTTIRSAGDPLKDIRNTTRVKLVIKDGKILVSKLDT